MSKVKLKNIQKKIVNTVLWSQVEVRQDKYLNIPLRLFTQNKDYFKCFYLLIILSTLYNYY